MLGSMFGADGWAGSPLSPPDASAEPLRPSDAASEHYARGVARGASRGGWFASDGCLATLEDRLNRDHALLVKVPSEVPCHFPGGVSEQDVQAQWWARNGSPGGCQPLTEPRC